MNRTSKKFKQVILITLATSTALLLSACGKNNNPTPKENTSSENTSSAIPTKTAAPMPTSAPAVKKENADQDKNFTAKLNAYTEGYNKLIGTFGLPETRQKYFAQNISSKSPTDNIFITVGWIHLAMNELKRGRALSSTQLEELDQAADQLISTLDKLTTQLNAIEIYYKSKAYKDDNLAKGKAQDPEIRANFDASVASMEKFNSVLSREQKKRNMQVLAKLKEEGNLLGYGTKLALQQGEELLSLFANEADIKNPEKYQQADQLIVQLEKTLAEQREQYAAAKAKNERPDSWHESAASYLTSLVGSYRDMKQSKKTKDFNEMVSNYNKAVENANRISR